MYDDSFFFVEGLAKVKKDGKFGFIDTRNQVVIPIQFDNAQDFNHGKAYVELNNQTYLVDKLGHHEPVK